MKNAVVLDGQRMVLVRNNVSEKFVAFKLMIETTSSSETMVLTRGTERHVLQDCILYANLIALMC
jgi:hypothetical protein